jgi:hypothetical protein
MKCKGYAEHQQSFHSSTSDKNFELAVMWSIVRQITFSNRLFMQMKPLDSEETRYEEVFVSGVLSCCIKAFNPPPTITCPADLTVVTALPGDMSVVVKVIS